VLRPAFCRTEIETIGPELDFIRRDKLNDLRPNYTREFIEMLAGGVKVHQPLPAGATPIPGTRSTYISLECMLAATALEALANNAEALAALNSSQHTVGGEFLGINRAVHYHARWLELGGALKKQAKFDVANCWRVALKQVEADYKTHRTAAQQLVEGIIEEAMRHPGYATRAAALRALNSDMAWRAKQTATKRRRIKKRKASA
jgi:hypothetical protein